MLSVKLDYFTSDCDTLWLEVYSIKKLERKPQVVYIP